MVLVVVDDLMFRSKISAAAKAVGAVVKVVTSPDAAMQLAAAERPALVILDLDSARSGPFEILRRLAADAELATVATLGFVSHVHADAIRRARELGIGEVLARSAFAASLPQILTRHGTAAPPSE
jgi:PleD family two-component response regulator